MLNGSIFSTEEYLHTVHNIAYVINYSKVWKFHKYMSKEPYIKQYLFPRSRSQCFAMCAVRSACGTSKFSTETNICSFYDKDDMREAREGINSTFLARVGMPLGKAELWALLRIYKGIKSFFQDLCAPFLALTRNCHTGEQRLPISLNTMQNAIRTLSFGLDRNTSQIHGLSETLGATKRSPRSSWEMLTIHGKGTGKLT